MGGFISGLFGGGEKKEKVVQPAREDEARAAAERESRRKRAGARGFASTDLSAFRQNDSIMGQMLKSRTGE